MSKYILITGIHDSKIPIDIDYVANPIIDIEKMVRDTTSGFEFQLPTTEIPLMYSDDDVIIEVTKNVIIPQNWASSTVNQKIYVDDNTDLIVDDLYWLKNERLKVTSKGNDSDGDYAYFDRKQKGTFPNAYFRDINNPYFITKYPKTFVGLRVLLYEDDNIIAIGIISANPIFNGTVLDIECDDLLKSLDVEFPKHLQGGGVNVSGTKIIPMYVVLEIFTQPFYYQTEIPPIADYFEMNLREYALFQWSDVGVHFDFDRFNNLNDFLEFYGKVNLSPLGFDQINGRYRFIPLSQQISLDDSSSASIGNYQRVDQSVKVEPYNGISEIRVTAPDGTIYNYFSTQAKAFNPEKRMEIDLSSFSSVSNYDIRQLGLKYVNQFSFIYSSIEIPSHAIKFQDFQVGKYYQVLDIEGFYTFQDTSDVAFCLGKDDNKIKFLIVKSGVKSPICPAVPVTITGSACIFGWATEDFFIRDFLNTSRIDISEAGLSEYDFTYFVASDVIRVQHSTTGSEYSKTIASMAAGTINLNSAPAAGNGEYWLFWDDYGSIVARQDDFFFNNVSFW